MTDLQRNQQVSWPWLNWAIIVVFAAVVVMIGVISAGVFDPKPLGQQLVGDFTLQTIDLQAGESLVDWLESSAPMGDHSLRLTAALASGEVDSAYGIVIGEPSEEIVVAVSPVGYVAIWHMRNGQQQMILPWQTWPHVALNDNDNELWLDVQGQILTSVRINRELLWQGEQTVNGRRIGTWAQSLNGPSSIDFQRLELFADEPQ